MRKRTMRSVWVKMPKPSGSKQIYQLRSCDDTTGEMRRTGKMGAFFVQTRGMEEVKVKQVPGSVKFDYMLGCNYPF